MEEISFGAFDSELMHQEINIPEGFTATIKGDKIILTRIENEDERIRKWLIEILKEHTQHDEPCIAKDALVWLEKQGEKKLVVPKFKAGDIVKDIEDGEVLTIRTVTKDKYIYTDDNFDWIKNQDTYVLVEQKPVDKAEPKFKVGDEIKTANEEPLTITKIDEKGYWSEDLFICGFGDAAKWELVGKSISKIDPKFHEGDWVVVSTIKGDRVVQIASVEYLKDGYPSYITTEGRWFGNGTKARLLTDKDVEIATIPESKIVVSKSKYWSEEDEERFQSCLNSLNILQPKGIIGGTGTINSKWLESLKQRIGG